MTTEFVVPAPILIAIVLLVVGLGRYTHGTQLVEQAAGRRRPGRVPHQQQHRRPGPGGAAAAGSLSDAGMSCTGMTADVDTGDFRPGGVVTVTVTCTADLSALALSGLPGAATISATGRAPLESLREFSDSGDRP